MIGRKIRRKPFAECKEAVYDGGSSSGALETAKYAGRWCAGGS